MTMRALISAVKNIISEATKTKTARTGAGTSGSCRAKRTAGSNGELKAAVVICRSLVTCRLLVMPLFAFVVLDTFFGGVVALVVFDQVVGCLIGPISSVCLH